MNEVNPSQEKLVRSGKFLYGGEPIGRVFIYQTTMRPGSGDYEDEPETRDDQQGTFYEIRYELESTAMTSRAGGGWCKSLPDATAHVERSVEKVLWDSCEYK